MKTGQVMWRLAVALTLALLLGGCADVGSALWLSGVALTGATEIVIPATAAGIQALTPPIPATIPGPPMELRVGSTRGSWTGICDPRCPTATEATHE